MYQIKGELIKKYDIEVKSETFRKQDIVIDTGGEYPQQIKLQCTNQLTEISDKLELGKVITCHFSLRGREWEGKHILNVNCYKIDFRPLTNMSEAQVIEPTPQVVESDIENLPF